MGHHCCSKQKVKRGLWSPEEDEKLIKHITTYGHKSWSSVPKLAGLQRCGKSCRLRWINYLRPDVKRGSFTEQEERIIIDIHRILGNRWAQIAKHLPGRTDNEVKNFWNSCIKKKLIAQGLDPNTHNLLSPDQVNNKNIAYKPLIDPPGQKNSTSSFLSLTRGANATSIFKTPFLTMPCSTSTLDASATYSSAFLASQGDCQNPISTSIGEVQGQTLLQALIDSTVKIPSSSEGDSFFSSPLASYGFKNTSHEKPVWATAISKEPYVATTNAETNEMMMSGEMQNIEASYESSSFGFDFAESTLLPSGFMGYDNANLMDQISWDYTVI